MGATTGSALVTGPRPDSSAESGAPHWGSEIAPGVHRIELPLGARRNSVILFAGTEGMLLFDTGVAGQLEDYLLPYLTHIGRDISDVRFALLSHADVDHWGGSGDLKRLAPRAVLACHRDDQRLIENTETTILERYDEFVEEHEIGWDDAFLESTRRNGAPARIDLALTGGERIHLGDGWTIEVLHVPGHSRGHLALWDERHAVLAIADAALSDSVNDADGAPSLPPTYRYVQAYRDSCRRLAALFPKWLLTAHFPVMSGAIAGEFLARSLAYTDRVEQALVDELASAREPVSTRTLIAALRPKLGSWPAGKADVTLASPLVGHLEDLQSAGRVRSLRGGGGPILWELSTE